MKLYSTELQGHKDLQSVFPPTRSKNTSRNDTLLTLLLIFFLLKEKTADQKVDSNTTEKDILNFEKNPME